MATTTNFGWETPDDTDLVKDGAAAMRTLGNSIDTSFVDLKGGTTNQVLAKNSNTDLDFKWVADATGIPATIIDAKGDLIAGTAADTAGRLAVGANGTVLTADSGETTGLKWASPASGFVGCLVYRNSTQSINSGADTEILFANEHFDTDGFHSTSTNTGRITIPTGKDGKYLFILHCGMTQGNQTGNSYWVKLTKNGNDVTQNVWYMQSTGVNPAGGFVYIIDAVATDYFQMYVLHNSTTAEDTLATTNYTTSFGCQFLGA